MNYSRCTPQQINRYRDRISGPLLDRIDLHIHVSTIPLRELQERPAGETSAEVRQRVLQHRSRQQQRQSKPNAALQGKELTKFCALGSSESDFLATALTKLNLSARAYDRTLRVARTIADMENSDVIQSGHLSEALGYRMLDRNNGTIG